VIATLRGLAILGGIALALLALLVVLALRGPKHEVVDRSLWPGFDSTKVTTISISHGAPASALELVGNEWRIVDSTALAAPSTVDALFTALRGGRWHRAAPVTDARMPKHPHGPRTVSIGAVSFSIGSAVQGTGQTWIVRSMPDRRDVALLVDDWIATALSPDPLELRVRQPLDCTGARQIEASISGQTIRIEHGRLAEPRSLWLDDGFLAQLAAACAHVEIVALDGRPAGAPGLRINVDGRTLTQTGTCHDTRQQYIEASVGSGCVAGAALDGLRDSLRSLLVSPQTAVDLQPLPIDPTRLTLADGTVLDIAKLLVGDVAADRDAVRDLVRASQTRGQSSIPRPAKQPRATIKAVDKAGTEVVLEIIDDAIGRAGEPALIRIDPRDLAIITRPASALRDATRWREDATTLSSFTLDGITYRRGAVLGEWAREPAGTVDAALVDALVETLATVRAPAAEPPRGIRHRLSLTFTPPAGTPTKHTIELAPPTGDGCPGRIDATPVRLPLALCTAVVALAAAR
jgi:hypothetical protein